MNLRNIKNIYMLIIGFVLSLFSLNDFKAFLNDNRGGGVDSADWWQINGCGLVKISKTKMRLVNEIHYSFRFA